MASLSTRAYGGARDLRRMQDAVAGAYDTTSLRAGDLAWLIRGQTHRQLSLDIRLWENPRGELVAWTFVRPGGGFNLFVSPGVGDDSILDEMLTVVEALADAAVEAGDPPVALYTYGLDLDRGVDDRALAAALERHGFHHVPSVGGVLRRPLDDLPQTVVPPGYHLGWVETRADVLGRVEAHRAAFAPSEVTATVYERVRRTWPYRAGLDRIASTDDGVVVAFCTAWIDEANAAGLLEPVGTHPAHQRRGLARAVCTDALWALRQAGALTAQVGFGSEAGRATYQSLGFVHLAADGVFRRDLPGQ